MMIGGSDMPIIKMSLAENEYTELLELASAEGMTIQDYIRHKLLATKSGTIFTPEEAERRAVEKFSENDPPFTLPDVYGDEWSELDPHMTGVFGKRFFNYLKKSENIEYAGMTTNKRRATYRIKKGE